MSMPKSVCLTCRMMIEDIWRCFSFFSGLPKKWLRNLAENQKKIVAPCICMCKSKKANMRLNIRRRIADLEFDFGLTLNPGIMPQAYV